MTATDYAIIGCSLALLVLIVWHGRVSFQAGTMRERRRHLCLVLAVRRWRDGTAMVRDVLEELRRLETSEEQRP